MFKCLTVLGSMILVLSSCLKNQTFDSGELHDDGQVAAGRHPSYWVAASPEYHENIIRAIFKIQDPDLKINFIWQHPVVERLQTWINTMDTEARQTIWGKKYMAATPKPRVLLIDNESPNAFVAPAFVKYKAEVIVPGSGEETEDVESIMSIQGNPSTIGAAYVEALYPFQPGKPSMLGDVTNRQKFILEKLVIPCVPNYSGQGKIIFKGCEVLEGSPTIRSSGYLSKQTSPYITVHMGLLRIMDEESIVAILAHELGHYYRAHATDDTKLGEGFFFYEKNAATGKRPEAIKNKEIVSRGKRVVLAAKHRVANSIPGAKVDSQVLMALLKSAQHEGLPGYEDFKASDFPGKANKEGFVPNYAIILRKCRTNHANKQDCDTLERQLNSPAISSTLNDRSMPEKSAYLALEAALLTATSDLKIGMQQGEMITVDSDKIPILLSFSGDENKIPMGITGACMQAYFSVRQPFIPLNDLLLNCGPELERTRKYIDHEINQMTLQGIGWYTTEQEADEIGAELIASVGIVPQKMPGSLFDLFKYLNDRKAKITQGLDYETCRKLSANNFGIGTGNVRTVAIGNWADNHHDLCYRIFNSTRDLLTHKYVAALEKRPKFPTAWADVLKSLPVAKGNNQPIKLDDTHLIE